MSGKSGAFELDRGVINAEGFCGFFLNGLEEALAFVQVHVRNAGMQAEGVVAATEGPDVHIMDFLDAFDGEHGASDVLDAELERSTFEEDVSGFAQDADAGPEDENTDGDAENRIDPEGAGEMNEDGAANDSDIGEGVAEIVNENAAEIEIAASTNKSEGDTAVNGESGEGSPNHPAFDDVYGRAEALDGFVTEPDGKEDKEDGVGESGEDAGAMVTVGFLGVGRTLSPAHGKPGDAKGGDIGEIVDGVVEQSDGTAE